MFSWRLWAAATVKGFLQALASGYAFQATWRHLALFSLLALAGILVAKNVRPSGPGAVH
ncbi:MAG: hypothetical protein ACP5NF_10060 [Thermoanaerobaculum sp.]